MGKPLPLVLGYFKNTRGKSVPVFRHLRVFGNGVQKFVNAVQLQRGAEHARKHSPAFYCLDNIGLFDFIAFIIDIHKLFVANGKLFKKIPALAVGKIDAAVAQLFLEVRKDKCFIRAVKVHFVYKDKARDIVFRQQPPKRYRMALNAVCCADDQNSVIKHLERALRFRGKIRMSGRVKQREFGAASVEHSLL